MSDVALVVGASRGLGRGVAATLASAGRQVITVSRSEAPFDPPVCAERADATDPSSTSLLAKYRPGLVVLVAGAVPPTAPFHEQTWETFSTNWNTDVRVAFEWLGAALRLPLRPGARVIVFSSGAALAGSPLSGGYAGSKATQRFLTGYAQDESDRAGLGLTFSAVLPRITPATDLGRPAVQAYAARGGQTEAEYLAGFGNLLTPAGAGAAVLELAGAESLAPSYLLTGDGLRPLD